MATFTNARSLDKQLAACEQTARHRCSKRGGATDNLRVHKEQVSGARWIWEKELTGQSGGILADEPGVGKTITIAFAMAGLPKRTLIVVPNALVMQWHNELLHRAGIKSVIIEVRNFELCRRVEGQESDDRVREKVDVVKGIIKGVPEGIDTYITTYSVFERFNSLRPITDAEKKLDRELIGYRRLLRELRKENPQSSRVKKVQRKLMMLSDERKKEAKKRRNPLCEISWPRLVEDEAHYAKKLKGVRFEQLARVSVQSRWLVTGTPLHNNTNDLVSLLTMLNVEGARELYKSTYDFEGLSSEQEAKLTSLFNEYCLRRLSKDVWRQQEQLPQMKYFPCFKDFTAAEQAFYDKIEIELDALEELRANAEHSKSFYNNLILKRQTHLRQICVSPRLCLESLIHHAMIPEERVRYKQLEQELPREASKMVLLREVVKGFDVKDRHRVGQPDKVIIYVQWNGEAAFVKGVLDDMGIAYVVLNGQVKKQVREEAKQAFQSFEPGMPNVLIAQMQVGGVGLNLQSANKIVFVVPDWNPNQELQGLHRAHRLGQTREVHVYGLAIRNTFEQISVRCKQYGKLCTASRILNDMHVLKHMKLDEEFASEQHSPAGDTDMPSADPEPDEEDVSDTERRSSSIDTADVLDAEAAAEMRRRRARHSADVERAKATLQQLAEVARTAQQQSV